ncbi:MAG: RDD family protein [Anaerolineae bacterium]|nr:RDD family protein [Anaerolineae bacterium]
MHRIAGNIVDLVVLDFVALPLFGLYQIITTNLEHVPTWIYILSFTLLSLLTVAYTLFFWTRSGRTPGMTAVGLRLVNGNGKTPSMKQAVIRLVVCILPIPGFSSLGAITRLGGIPFQDKLSSTSITRD